MEGWLGDAATLGRHANGQVTVKETHDWDAGQGVLFGIVVGGLVGAVMGPMGALVGATAAGAAGAVVAPLVDLGIPNQYLTQVHELLPPGHSALLVVVRTKGLKRLLTELSQESEKVLHWTLEGDFEPALDATLPEIKTRFDSLWHKHAETRTGALETLEAERAALETQIASANALIAQAKPNAPAGFAYNLRDCAPHRRHFYCDNKSCMKRRRSQSDWQLVRLRRRRFLPNCEEKPCHPKRFKGWKWSRMPCCKRLRQTLKHS